MLASLKAKIDAGDPLEDDDVLKLIILPLTQPDKSRKQKLIEDSIDLAKSVKDERQQLFAVAGIVTATNKFIDAEYMSVLERWIKMTKIARLFEEEKIEAVNQNDKNVRREIARKLLGSGLEIAKVMQATGLTRAEIDEIMLPVGT